MTSRDLLAPLPDGRNMGWDVIQTPQGPVHVWNWNMTRIEVRLLDTVIYLYPSEDAANKGDPVGGSGFLLAVESSVVQGKKHIIAQRMRCIMNSADL